MPRPGLRKPTAVNGAAVLTGLWLGIPLLGKAFVFLSVFLLPAGGDRLGKRHAPLRWFMWLSLLYGVWITFRALLAGADAMDPILDTLPVMVLPVLAYHFVREPFRIEPGVVYRLLVVLALLICVASVFEVHVFDGVEAELGLGNPFNLAAALLLPAMILTFDRLAPDKIWFGAGLIGFALLVWTMGALVQTRSLFLGIVVLGAVRCVASLFEPHSLRARAGLAGAIAVALILPVLVVLVVNDQTERLSAVAGAASAQSDSTEWSVGLRQTMIEAGLDAARSRPFVGYGPQNRFSAAFDEREALPIELSHLHNEFLTHAVGGGLIAVLLMCAMVIYPALAGLRNGAGLTPVQTALRRQIGLLSTLGLLGTAAVNNLYFVDVSAFTTTLSILWTLVFLGALGQARHHE